MGRAAPWPWWHQGTGSDDYRIRELLRAILDLHGYFGGTDSWLWRGQANCDHTLSPGVHTRLQISGMDVSDQNVVGLTEALIQSTRNARLDWHENAVLPDLPLLARLQHHGAATPLLDVSLDPLVALYMAVVSPNPADNAQDGVLFAIPKPKELATGGLQPYDTRPFRKLYEALPADQSVFYSAPDVSDRLRIQRGHFLISKVPVGWNRVSIIATMEYGRVNDTWLSSWLSSRGIPGNRGVPWSDVAVFRITAKFKEALRAWLEVRTGLTPAYVYPTVWHQPHGEAFARSQGRKALFAPAGEDKKNSSTRRLIPGRPVIGL